MGSWPSASQQSLTNGRLSSNIQVCLWLYCPPWPKCGWKSHHLCGQNPLWSFDRHCILLHNIACQRAHWVLQCITFCIRSNNSCCWYLKEIHIVDLSKIYFSQSQTQNPRLSQAKRLSLGVVENTQRCPKQYKQLKLLFAKGPPFYLVLNSKDL